VEKREEDLLMGLDKGRTTRFHVKTIFTAGMGFFTDAYDLFVTSTALPIIMVFFGITNSNNIFGVSKVWIFPAASFEEGLIGSMALFGAFVGALVFGRIADIYGRKYIYGLEMSILVVFAIFTAFSVNASMLIAGRFVLGIGIGGDYPVSSTIMSEYSNIKNRGKLVQSVFAMQGFGLLLGAIVGILAIHTVPLYYSWRIMLGFGAIPAASVIYLRRKIKETPRYSIQTKHDLKAGSQAISEATGTKIENIDVVESKVSPGPKRGLLRKYSWLLLATAGSWFLFDMAFYGTTINNGTIFKAMGVASGVTLYSQVNGVAIGNIIISLAFAIPGYWVAFALLDIVGRKKLQWIGFTVMAVIYFVFAIAFVGLKTDIVLFVGLYGISYFFGNLGPNSTTFILPTELFPTAIRTTAHGISASSGKLGAGTFTLLEPAVAAFFGITAVFSLLCGFALIAIILTLTLIKETKGKSLEILSEQKLPNTERHQYNFGK